MEALIIVDVQNDFCAGGALAVNDADSIVPGINAVVAAFELVVTTQDWHPANHGSFASNNGAAAPLSMGTLNGRPQVMWPDHCVQNTAGAEFHPRLAQGLKAVAANFVKGTNPDADSYSGFFDDDGGDTGLHTFLQEHAVKTVYLCGLATDYCVRFSALDALRLGYKTVVLEDLTRPVNLQPNDAEAAIKELRDAGAQITHNYAKIIHT